MPAVVHLAVADGVATITLDSQHNRNALSRQLVGELAAALGAAEADGAARVVVLRAEGPTFCAGADLFEALADGMAEGTRVVVALLRQIVALDKPVVGRVHGAVRAGGIGLVAACDVVVADAGSTFALTEARLGLTAATISLTVLPRMTSRAASWTFLSGATFDGAAAAQMGLVTTAVSADRLDDEVAAAVAGVATGAPQGLRETKRLLNAGLVADIDARGEELAALSARLFGSDEARAAMREFLQRR
ncbi:MAG: enoyl-CoA hydratase-related protein [Nocardioidaceae bacterium]